MLENILFFLNSIPTEVMLVIEFVTVIALLLTFLNYFGLVGLNIFQVITLFVANIQVLKMVEYNFYPDPVALGKVMISLSFFTVTIIVEFYGKAQAKRAIWLGLCSSITFSTLMLLTMGYKPYISADPSYMQFAINDESIKRIFLPLPSILIAGVISYICCQYLDVFLFSKIKEKTNGKYLWMRSFFAPAVTAFFDNIIFYSFAFYILSPHPLPLDVLIRSYILGTYIFRVSIIFIAAYIMHAAKYIVLRNQNRIQGFDVAYNYNPSLEVK